MKKNLLLVLFTSFTFASFTSSAQYIDLSTGRKVTLVKHYGNGFMYNTETQRPVYIYINPTTSDTFYGRTGENINGKVTRTREGRYSFNDDAYVYRDGEYVSRADAGDDKGPDYKKKVKSDGTFKEKDVDYKRKIESDGDLKIKEDGAKMKAKNDGELKVKDGDYRRKIDEQGNEKQKDATGKTKENVDGSLKVKDKDEQYKGKVDTDGDVKQKDQNGKRKAKKDKLKVKDEEGKAKAKEEGNGNQ
jgi:hypothetical protein